MIFNEKAYRSFQRDIKELVLLCARCKGLGARAGDIGRGYNSLVYFHVLLVFTAVVEVKKFRFCFKLHQI